MEIKNLIGKTLSLTNETGEHQIVIADISVGSLWCIFDAPDGSGIALRRPLLRSLLKNRTVNYVFAKGSSEEFTRVYKIID